MSYQAIKDKLSRGETVLLDGGVGTEVLRRGVYWRCHGIERRPEMVRHVDRAVQISFGLADV